MMGLKRVGVVVAGLVVGAAGCRHTCGDQSRYSNCNSCGTRAALLPQPAAPNSCAPCAGAVSYTPGPRLPVVGSPVSSGPFDTGPYAPTVPSLPNELPPPMENIPAPAVPIPATPSAANVLPPPVTQPTGLGK